jgi:hypothetical protein
MVFGQARTKYSGDVLAGEGVGGVRDQQACLTCAERLAQQIASNATTGRTDSSISDDDALDGLHGAGADVGARE